MLVVFFLIGSIDFSKVDDSGFLSELVVIDPAENGFLVVSYTENNDFELLNEEQRNMLKSHIISEAWDASYANEIFVAHAKVIADFLSAAEFKSFQFELPVDVSSLPMYVPIMDMARLVLLKSRSLAEQGMLDKAIALSGKAVYMSSQVKSESNSTLISHMIGLAMQYEALHWLGYLAGHYSMNHDQIKNLLAVVNRVPSYDNDGFEHVFAGEYRFSKKLMAEISDPPLGERWEVYSNGEDYWNSDIDENGQLEERAIRHELLALLTVLFPKFYIHKRETQSLTVKKYKTLADKSHLYCTQLAGPALFDGKNELSWSALITPNALIDSWYFDFEQTFYTYFYRRCLGHAHIESTKALLALRLYEQDYGEWPDSLVLLQPKYLNSLPIDPFDGSVMRYSKADGWLYSLGVNFEDNGGSIAGYFVNQCQSHEACKNNPTFPR